MEMQALMPKGWIDFDYLIRNPIKPTHLFVNLEDKDFEDKFVSTPIKMFAGEMEGDALEFMDNCPHLIEKVVSTSIFSPTRIRKEGNEYYYKVHYRGCGNKQKNAGLSMHIYSLVVPEIVNPYAIRNLQKVVQGDLSLGDRKLIKDVALDTFYWMLDFSSKKENPRYHLIHCLSTGLNQMALSRLQDYGFKIKSPRFRSFDLSGNIL